MVERVIRSAHSHCRASSCEVECKWRTRLIRQLQWVVTVTKQKEQIVVDGKAATARSARISVLPGVMQYSDYIGVSH